MSSWFLWTVHKSIAIRLGRATALSTATHPYSGPTQTQLAVEKRTHSHRTVKLWPPRTHRSRNATKDCPLRRQNPVRPWPVSVRTVHRVPSRENAWKAWAMILWSAIHHPHRGETLKNNQVQHQWNLTRRKTTLLAGKGRITRRRRSTDR